MAGRRGLTADDVYASCARNMSRVTFKNAEEIFKLLDTTEIKCKVMDPNKIPEYLENLYDEIWVQIVDKDLIKKVKSMPKIEE